MGTTWETGPLAVPAVLTAAPFLVVLLLVEGWRRSPATAAPTVSGVPVAGLHDLL